MTDAKTNEAEKRYRRVMAGEQLAEIYADKIHDDSQADEEYDEDARTLAREWIWLRDKREADERERMKLVDCAWLESQGLVNSARFRCLKRYHIVQSVYVEALAVPGGWKFYLRTGNGRCFIDPTRGQVLDLLAALGMGGKTCPKN